MTQVQPHPPPRRRGSRPKHINVQSRSEGAGIAPSAAAAGAAEIVDESGAEAICFLQTHNGEEGASGTRAAAATVAAAAAAAVEGHGVESVQSAWRVCAPLCLPHSLLYILFRTIFCPYICSARAAETQSPVARRQDATAKLNRNERAAGQASPAETAKED